MSYLTKLFNLTHLYSSDLCNCLISGLHNFNKSTNFSLIQLTKSNFFEWSFFYFNFGTSWSNRFWNRVICFCLFDHCFFFFLPTGTICITVKLVFFPILDARNLLKVLNLDSLQLCCNFLWICTSNIRPKVDKIFSIFINQSKILILYQLEQ